MRKTLLIAAAAFAASVISSQAQVYSQNIVGYVNINLTNGVLANIAPALDLDGTGTNNTVATVFTTPNIGDNVYAFNGTGYDALNYKVVVTGRSPNQVYNTNWFIGLTAEPGYKLNPGESLFYLPSANETVTQTGTALTGSQVNPNVPTPGNLGLLSSIIPISGGLTSVLGYTPNIGDNVFVYNGTGYTAYNYKVVVTGRSPNQVYNTNWFIGLTATEPVINVGQGFWLQTGAANTWTETLNVQ
jgi:hypothetical protein